VILILRSALPERAVSARLELITEGGRCTRANDGRGRGIRADYGRGRGAHRGRPGIQERDHRNVLHLGRQDPQYVAPPGRHPTHSPRSPPELWVLEGFRTSWAQWDSWWKGLGLRSGHRAVPCADPCALLHSLCLAAQDQGLESVTRQSFGQTSLYDAQNILRL
jgi:hypothetical protein